jgi:hypothetical protein
MKGLRHEHGSLDLQTLEARPILVQDEILDLRVDERYRAKDLLKKDKSR